MTMIGSRKIFALSSCGLHSLGAMRGLCMSHYISLKLPEILGPSCDLAPVFTSA